MKVLWNSLGSSYHLTHPGYFFTTVHHLITVQIDFSPSGSTLQIPAGSQDPAFGSCSPAILPPSSSLGWTLFSFIAKLRFLLLRKTSPDRSTNLVIVTNSLSHCLDFCYSNHVFAYFYCNKAWAPENSSPFCLCLNLLSVPTWKCTDRYFQHLGKGSQNLWMMKSERLPNTSTGFKVENAQLEWLTQTLVSGSYLKPLSDKQNLLQMFSVK